LAVGLLDHGILENGQQPVEDCGRQKVLFLDGELYNVPELKRRFSACFGQREMTAPEVCLRLIARHGVDVVKYFNGLFCLVLYDRSSHELTLISDRFGFRPLFYVHRPTAFVFGSELKAVCVGDPDRRTVDDIGTIELFVYGSNFGDRTWLKDYLRLPPATIMTIGAGGVKQRKYWSYKYDETAPTLDQPTYYTVFASLMGRAVERCLKGSHRIGLFLSGGYDSRSVAAAIPKEYLPLPAFTFGHPESRDVRYAQLLASRLGLHHHALTENAPYLYSHSRAIVWRTEGMNSFANCTSVRFHPRIKEKADIILLGFLGEFSGSHTWPRLLLARSRRAAKEAIFDHLVNSRLPRARKVFNAQFFSTGFASLRERFEVSFDCVQNDHPLNIADSWNFMHLQPRGTFQSPAVDRHLFEARAPHMDHDLVDFLLTIPPYSRLEQRVYKQMIAYKFPAIRDVPCTNSGKPINPHFIQEYAGMATGYLLRRAATWVNGRSENGDVPSREFRDLGEDFRQEPQLVDDVLLPLLDAEIFPPSLFDYAGIRDVIVEHYEGKRSHEYLLSLLISYGLAMKYFLHDDCGDVPANMCAA
jgi:asparagine synthase (glutamine-hydrolysing)